MEAAVIEGSRIDPTELATIELLACLDDFLVGLAFLYFAYGIYSLFIQLGRKMPDQPDWLRISSMGTLEKNLPELLVVPESGMDLLGDPPLDFGDRRQHSVVAIRR